MPLRLVRVRGRGLCGLAAFILSILLAAALQAEAPRPEETLPLGEIRERQIKADEVHAWRITVAPGTALLVTVDQHSIALMVEARGPEGREPIAVHAGERWGPEVLLLETAGEFRIEVRPQDKSVWPGKYTIRTETLLEGKSDKRDALTLMSRAGQETVLDTLESRRQAVALYRQALEAWRSLGDRAQEAETLSCIAILEANSSELRPATEDFLAGLKLWQELKERQREAETLNWLGNIYRDTQEVAKAREPLEKALSLWHGLEESFQEAETRGNLCLLELVQGSLSAALTGFQANLEFFRSRGIQTQEAKALHLIGAAYDFLGEPDKALASYESALSLRHALGDSYGEAETLNNIAVLHRTLGEWQEALRIYEQARVVLEPLGDRDLEARLFNNVAVVYNSLGEPERALPYLKKALKLRHDMGIRKAEVTSLNNLGSAWRRLGELKKALREHRRALALAVSLKDVAQQATSHLRLAEVHLDQADASAALGDLDTALALVRENGNRRIETEVLHQQARALTLAGRAREALPTLQEVLARRRAGRDRAGEAETLYVLAVAERSLGLADEARSHAEDAVARVEELRTGFLSADLRASFLATRGRVFSLLIDLLMDRKATDAGKDFDGDAFAISERAHARSLVDVLRAGNAGHTGSTAPPDLLKRRTTLLRGLSAKIEQKFKQSGERAATLQEEIEATLVDLNSVEAKIARLDQRFAAFSTMKSLAPKEIFDLLEPGTMLLEYSLGEDRSFLWALAAGQIHAFILPSQKEIENLARSVYEQMSTVGAGGTANREKAAEKLSQILLAPIWGDTATLGRLVVVPDGALGILPFAALPVPNRGRSWTSPGALKPLMERLEIVSIPSVTTLAVQRQRMAQRTPAAK
ncbi:MAG TPA: tetratricopeptide repeat protein, partial [Thermoanaerobaculia bacterium]|nr:tetratricopeptide repeat protein [Thermoanaerobaculia bacterium]